MIQGLAWQDAVILLAQATMAGALIPTLLDRARWPHPVTAALTGLCLLAMAFALWHLHAVASAVATAVLGAGWLHMIRGGSGRKTS